MTIKTATNFINKETELNTMYLIHQCVIPILYVNTEDMITNTGEIVYMSYAVVQFVVIAVCSILRE